MWARTAEVMLGCWLLLSPFIFRHPNDATAWWINDLMCGTVVILLALFSFWRFSIWPGMRRIHLAILPVGMWMIGFAFFTTSYPPTAAAQNNILVALLLLMMALVPTDPELPPEEWQEFLSKEMEQEE